MNYYNYIPVHQNQDKILIDPFVIKITQIIIYKYQIYSMRRQSPIKNEYQHGTIKEKDISHRKEIQKTLNELHRLQSQIYELNIAQNPHGSAPIKKQIKQLAYLYDNMTKPKEKNKLNIQKQDIRTAFKVIDPYSSEQVQVKNLKKVMKDIYNHDFDVSLISEVKGKTISLEEMYSFVNYNDFDDFDPIRQAYNVFLNEKGEFDFNKLNQFNQMFGIPKARNKATLHAALECEDINFQEFKKFATLKHLDKY